MVIINKNKVFKGYSKFADRRAGPEAPLLAARQTRQGDTRTRTVGVLQLPLQCCVGGPVHRETAALALDPVVVEDRVAGGVRRIRAARTLAAVLYELGVCSRLAKGC